MAQTYLFFRPVRLPLGPDDLGASTVLNLADSPSLRAGLERLLPGLAWGGDGRASARVDGNWYEVQLPRQDATVAIRCSLRADHTGLIQRICDDLGWLAFDERPFCFQPHRQPFGA